MNIEENIFKRATVVFEKLKDYGFAKERNGWLYTRDFMNGDFRAVVKIDEKGNITGNVFDADSGDVYFPLRIESVAIGFAGEVRAEYVKILEDIKAHCCRINYFISPQSNRLSAMIAVAYGDQPDFPWDKSPGCGVFRNPNNKKWYALVMNVDAGKVDKKRSGEVEIVNIKLDENKIPVLLGQKGFYPAYHMNKKNWITIVLDGTLSDAKLSALIAESRSFTLGKKGGRARNGGSAWLIPANPRYFDIEAAFAKKREIIWKQSSDVKAGDIAYMYVGSPVSAVLYKCEVTAANISYDYADANLKIRRVMKIKRLKKYAPDFMPFARLCKLGVRAVRGPRLCPDNVLAVLQ